MADDIPVFANNGAYAAGRDQVFNYTQSPELALVFDDLGIQKALWDRDSYWLFTLANTGGGILFVDSMVLKIAHSTPSNLLRAPCAGAGLAMFDFRVALTPSQSAYPITDRFFVYKNGDVDGFRLALTSIADYTYDIYIEVEWHHVGRSCRRTTASITRTVSFDIDDANRAIGRIDGTRDDVDDPLLGY